MVFPKEKKPKGEKNPKRKKTKKNHTKKKNGGGKPRGRIKAPISAGGQAFFLQGSPC